MSILGPAIRPRDIRYIRSAVEDGLTDRCVIYTYSQEPDGFGGYEETWTSVGHETKCRLTPLPEREGRGKSQEYSDQIVGRDQGTMTFPWDTEIKQLDHVVIVTGPSAEKTFRVNMDFVIEDGSRSDGRRVIVEPVTPGSRPDVSPLYPSDTLYPTDSLFPRQG